MKKNNFKYMILFLSFLLGLTALSGCSKDPKNFTVTSQNSDYSSGTLTITLNKSFKESKHEGFDLYLTSENVIFSVAEETEEELEYSGYTIVNLKSYCQEILLLNDVAASELKQRNDYYYFVNTKTISGAKYTYVHCMYYGGGSYWICEFVCKSKKYDNYKDRIFKWADSVTIN